ncbi:hypothetical protein V1507DRAFT_410805 [Lipomyces tetrasporus]
MAIQYGRDYILSDGTIISMPTETQIDANRRNATFMAQLYDNMTYIDNDSIQNTGRPVFSVFVTGEPHLVTPRVRLEDRRLGLLTICRFADIGSYRIRSCE